MRKISKLFAIFCTCCATLLLIVGCTNNASSSINNDEVVLKIELDEHTHTSSQNPQIVKKGEFASFYLFFDENYNFASADDATYDEELSLLAVSSEYGNKTIKVNSKQIGGHSLTIINDNNFGNISISPNKSFFDDGETVTVKATSKSKTFLCYTFDGPYRVGIHKTSYVPVSFDSSYTFTMNKDITIVANYFSDNGTIIDYDLNGGQTRSGNSFIHTDYYRYSKYDFICPNSINLSCYAFRDGYILDSLNTKEDGSGIRIGIGSRIDNSLFINNRVLLYAIWVQYTDPSLFDVAEMEDKTLSIIGSKTISDSNLVIPGYIENKKVTQINSGAINQQNGVTDVYLPDTIRVVEDGAFSNMTNFTSLHLYTSVEKISRDSFRIDSLTNIYLNKNTYPTDNQAGWDNLIVRRDFIRYLQADKPIVVPIGHSTTRQNHSLQPLIDKWGDKYSFYIYGASAGIDGYLLLASIQDLLRECDYIIFPMWRLLEANNISPRNFTFLQLNFDLLLNANYQYMKGFFWESFVLYRKISTNELGVEASLHESRNVIYTTDGGDVDGVGSDDPNNGSEYDYTYYHNGSTMDRYQYLHYSFEHLKVLKEHILLTWNTFNINAIHDDTYFNKYENDVREEFSYCTFFDTQHDNFYPGDYFLVNDCVHVSVRGGNARVNRWVQQLPLE